MNKNPLRFLLLPAALAATLGPAFAQNNLPNAADALRQNAVIEAHSSDLATISTTLGIVDAAVVCTIKDAKWGMTYRPIVLRAFDQFAHEIGLSDETIYALRQDVESNAHKVTIATQCDKITGKMVDDLTAMLNGWH